MKDYDWNPPKFGEKQEEICSEWTRMISGGINNVR